MVLADGSHRDIEDVQVGDEVLATDPETGETSAQPVLGTITTKGDKNLVQITVTTDASDLPWPAETEPKRAQSKLHAVKHSKNGVLIATDNHPFWVAGDISKWVEAADLKPGMWLRTSAGTYVQIAAVEHRVTHDQRVHNLTVANFHTYYVEAGDTPLLVHNCGPDDLVHVYRAPQRGNGADELANGLNPARHSEPGGRAYVGTEDVAQKYADYSVGTHEDYYIKFTFRRSEFEEHFGAGLKYEGGPGLEWEIPHARIDLFNRLTIAKDKLWAPW